MTPSLNCYFRSCLDDDNLELSMPLPGRLRIPLSSSHQSLQFSLDYPNAILQAKDQPVSLRKMQWDQSENGGDFFGKFCQ